jgi:hypothetical protein
MIYQVRQNKTMKNIKVYIVKKSLRRKETFMTKLFLRLFKQDQGGAVQGERKSATEGLR